MDAAIHYLEAPFFATGRKVPVTIDKLIEGLEKIHSLLPDPDALDGGEYAIGKEIANADCAIVPFLAWIQIATKATFAPDEICGDSHRRLKRYMKVLMERESVKKVIDLVRAECLIQVPSSSMFGRLRLSVLCLVDVLSPVRLKGIRV
ncbi:hypothetical protein JVU11DRAFT_4172 [Chiua virens]|nr:hypothetical protein JVU11DRAFT_4172 [Chiua virens]